VNKPWKMLLEQLAAEGRFAEFEALARQNIPNAWFALYIAEMHAGRLSQYQADGNHVAALAAHAAAESWARTFASMATSGGEGAAFSRERDELLRLLGKAPPGNP